MRSLVLSAGAIVLALGVAWAQSPSGGGTSVQIPYGQTFKDFLFPYYQDGQLKFTLHALSAKGVTLNRAEATELTIKLYDSGKTDPATIITSPKADLYVADRRMRTKNTVQIERDDLEATAQTCDFDLMTKKYLLRDNVKVTLKNFDTGKIAPGNSSQPSSGLGASAAHPTPTPSVPPMSPPPSRPLPHDDTLLDVPGAAAASTNSAPANP